MKQDPEFITQDIMLDLAIQISKKLAEDGLTQKDLAQRMGVSEGWISRFMNAPTNWSVEKLVRIGLAVGLKLSVSFEQYDNANTINNKGTTVTNAAGNENGHLDTSSK